MIYKAELKSISRYRVANRAFSSWSIGLFEMFIIFVNIFCFGCASLGADCTGLTGKENETCQRANVEMMAQMMGQNTQQKKAWDEMPLVFKQNGEETRLVKKDFPATIAHYLESYYFINLNDSLIIDLNDACVLIKKNGLWELKESGKKVTFNCKKQKLTGNIKEMDFNGKIIKEATLSGRFKLNVKIFDIKSHLISEIIKNKADCLLEKSYDESGKVTKTLEIKRVGKNKFESRDVGSKK